MPSDEKSTASEHSETLFKGFKKGKSGVMTHTIPVLQRQGAPRCSRPFLPIYILSCRPINML